MEWESWQLMNKQFSIFLLAVALLLGSFFGTYARRSSELPNISALNIAKNLIDNAAGDQAKLSAASDLLKTELQQVPSNLSALFLQARAFQQRGLIDQALKSYEQFFAQNISTSYAANYNSGELAELKGDLAHAEAYFAECTRIAPLEGSGWEKLIRLLLKQQRNADAKEHFKTMIKILPSSDAVKRLSLIMP